MICSKCSHEVRPDAKFCDNCGTPITPSAPEPVLTCLVCGAAIEPGAAFCPKCGMPSVASQSDMTIVLPKKPVSKKDDTPELEPAPEFPTLLPSDDATRVISPSGQGIPDVDEKTRIIAASARPAVPMATNASAEETIMVLDPPPVKPAKRIDPARQDGSRQSRGTAKSHKSAKITSELERQKRRAEKKPPKAASNTLLIGGIVGAVVLVVVAVAAFWWLKPHRAGKPVEVPTVASAPAVAPSAPAAVPPPAQSATPQPVQPPVEAAVVAASDPAVPPTSDLKTEKRPALIVAPSVSAATEATPETQKSEKSEKTEKSESSKPASSAKSSRKQPKATSKSNQEDDYLRQIHRQLDRQH